MTSAANLLTTQPPNVTSAIESAGRHMEGAEDWLRLALACVDQASDVKDARLERAMQLLVAVLGPVAHEPSYTLDGEALDLDEFVEANREGMPELGEVLTAVRDLRPGEEIHLGGGAAATFTIGRTR